MARLGRAFCDPNTQMIVITLPDGSQRQYPGPVTVAEIAQSIGTGLARAALGGRVTVNGTTHLVDTIHRIEQDASLAIITAKDPEGLDLIRHSTAHLLAYAVKSLFPDAQVTIGPVIENGFYYDFSYKRPFTPEDLEAIEKKMAELVRKDEVVTREVWLRPNSSLPSPAMSPSRCTARAISSTSAAVRTCRARANSRSSSS